MIRKYVFRFPVCCGQWPRSSCTCCYIVAKCSVQHNVHKVQLVHGEREDAIRFIIAACWSKVCSLCVCFWLVNPFKFPALSFSFFPFLLLLLTVAPRSTHYAAKDIAQGALLETIATKSARGKETLQGDLSAVSRMATREGARTLVYLVKGRVRARALGRRQDIWGKVLHTDA